MSLRAIAWDVDGTLAETERDGHRVAFNEAFAIHGLPWAWSVAHYGRLLQVAGGLERLLVFMADAPEAPRPGPTRESLARTLHATKNRLYAERVRAGAVRWRGGVRELIDEAAHLGIRQAIATTTSRANVEALLGPALGDRFELVLAAEDAPRKKPDPMVYRLLLDRMALPAWAVVAIEDSPAGLAAARAAGIQGVVARSEYFADAGFPGALAVGPGLDRTAGWSPAPHPGSRIDWPRICEWADFRRK